MERFPFLDDPVGDLLASVVIPVEERQGRRWLYTFLRPEIDRRMDLAMFGLAHFVQRPLLLLDQPHFGVECAQRRDASETGETRTDDADRFTVETRRVAGALQVLVDRPSQGERPALLRRKAHPARIRTDDE